MANTKISALTENTSRHFNDVYPMVDDPAGTPLTQKQKLVNQTGLIVNAQTGTTYTYLTGDYGKLVTHTNGSAIAGTLPQAGASFPANWFMLVQNRGAGAVTITPTTSTIDGAATLVLNQSEGAVIVSDGTNYFTMRGKTIVGAGGGAPSTATYITQVAESGLSAEQALAALATGLVKVTTTTGVLSTAVLNTDYVPPLTAAHGSDDTYTGQTISGLNAGATIAQWEAVYLDSSSTWQLADANGSGTYPARGLAVAAYVNTNPAIILVHGTVRNDAWAWTPGGTIYLSGTAGALTQTAPSTSGDKVQQVGFALTADIIFVDFNSTYLTVT